MESKVIWFTQFFNDWVGPCLPLIQLPSLLFQIKNWSFLNYVCNHQWLTGDLGGNGKAHSLLIIPYRVIQNTAQVQFLPLKQCRKARSLSIMMITLLHGISLDDFTLIPLALQARLCQFAWDKQDTVAFLNFLKNPLDCIHGIKIICWEKGSLIYFLKQFVMVMKTMSSE